MAVLLPFTFNENWCSMNSSRIVDQQFGLDLDDLLSLITLPKSSAADHSRSCQAASAEAESAQTESAKAKSAKAESAKAKDVASKVSAEKDMFHGLDLNDLLSFITLPRSAGDNSRSCQAESAKAENVLSEVSAEKDKFQVNVNVQQFKPDEIMVKVTGENTIVVEGKHEEKEDEHGFVSRHFIRRFVLPEDHDINNVMSNLSSDGILSITAPRIEQAKEQRTIPIQCTGVSSKPLDNN